MSANIELIKALVFLLVLFGGGGGLLLWAMRRIDRSTAHSGYSDLITKAVIVSLVLWGLIACGIAIFVW